MTNVNKLGVEIPKEKVDNIMQQQSYTKTNLVSLCFVNGVPNGKRRRQKAIHAQKYSQRPT